MKEINIKIKSDATEFKDLCKKILDSEGAIPPHFVEFENGKLVKLTGNATVKTTYKVKENIYCKQRTYKNGKMIEKNSYKHPITVITKQDLHPDLETWGKSKQI